MHRWFDFFNWPLKCTAHCTWFFSSSLPLLVYSFSLAMFLSGVPSLWSTTHCVGRGQPIKCDLPNVEKWICNDVVNARICLAYIHVNCAYLCIVFSWILVVNESCNVHLSETTCQPNNKSHNDDDEGNQQREP